MLKMKSYIICLIIVGGSSIFADDLPLVKVHPEPSKPYIVITSNKTHVIKGEKVKISVFLVNPTNEAISIRSASLFRDDGAPVDGSVSYKFKEDRVKELYATPRGKRSSYTNVGDRPYDIINANSHISDSFEWLCDQGKTGEYTFGFSFHASPFAKEAIIKLRLNDPKSK